MSRKKTEPLKFNECEFANMALEMMINMRRRNVAQDRIDFCCSIMRQMEVDYSKPGRADREKK